MMKMTTSEIVTLLLAIYGASLSTYLGAREIQKERRRIKIFLEFADWVERAQITIVNVGHRPITITEIGMSMKPLKIRGSQYEGIPTDSLYSGEGNYPHLPKTLEDGEHITLPLSSVVSREVGEGSTQIKLSVYDAEGNVFNKFKLRRHDKKWGTYY
jgi:hypothetical protein